MVLLSITAKFSDKCMLKNFNLFYMPENKEIVCNCLELEKQVIINLIHEKGIKNLNEIGLETRAGLLCGICTEELKHLLIQHREK